jgi:hypothetical protein
MVKSAEDIGPPPQALMDAIAKGGEQAARSGVLVMTGGLAPTAMSTRVRASRGKLTVTDGPFTETKEVVGGFAVLELSSKEEAIEQARWLMQLHIEHWPEWEGETEVRAIVGAPEPARGTQP